MKIRITIVIFATLILSGLLVFRGETFELRNSGGEGPATLNCASRKKVTGEGEYAGRLAHIEGHNCYRQTSNERPQSLDPLKDLMAEVFVGQKFQCFGGSILFEFADSRNEKGVGTTLEQGRCLLVRQSATIRTDPSGKGAQVRGGSGAGLKRGDSGPFCSPANQSAVVPEEFVFRWLPAAVGSTLSLAIYDPTHREVGRVDNVTGKMGELTDEHIRSNLRAYRDAQGKNPLLLIAEDSGGRSFSLQFSLLAKSAELELQRDLAACDAGAHGIMLPFCRIAALRQRKMLWEVAREYENALQLAPGSEAIAAEALRARLEIGDAACARR